MLRDDDSHVHAVDVVNTCAFRRFGAVAQPSQILGGAKCF